MPLKHSTETAYLVFLALLICVAGFVASLLPALSEGGLPYWVLSFTVACLYPIFLMPTFRNNRADYEFRLLHWFPAGVFVLWMLLQVIDPYWEWFHILNLGFFTFWSLPLVAFGLSLGAAFSMHVLRRRTVRVAFLSLFLALFTVGAVMAETQDINPRLQAKIFTGNPITSLRPVMTRVRSILANLRYPQSSGSTVLVSSLGKSSARSSRMSSRKSESSSVASSVIAEHTPNGLPRSGPEAPAVLFATLVALYMGTLHVRGKKRA
ncbi:hypothetical protein EXS65_03455 [Candidatus Peribacteria bacterium]|nr:hypothetical protein [Candidatus Peribacteria bacterium]